RSFERSSNFLAVRLAEIFRGEHIAVLDHTDPLVEKEYMQKLRNIDLLICGAGGMDSLLTEHAREQRVHLPANMVGDFAFIPLDGEGRPIECNELQKLVSSLSPHPGYAEVLRIARDQAKSVLVIFSGPDSKLPAANAILTSGLATDCVLSVS